MRLFSLLYLTAAIGTVTAGRCRPFHSVSVSSVSSAFSVSSVSSASSASPSPVPTCDPTNLLGDGAETNNFGWSDNNLDRNGFTTDVDCGDGHATCITIAYTNLNDGSHAVLYGATSVTGSPYAWRFFSVSIRVNNVPTTAKITIGGSSTFEVSKVVDLSTFSVGEYQVVTLSGIQATIETFVVSISMDTEETFDVTLSDYSVTLNCSKPAIPADEIGL